MGIPMVIKFIKAVCASKKSWQARHTGIKSVQQIAILMGCAVLPHLTDLVHAIMNGLLDENQKVKTITALALAALAEAAAPYGIESFDAVLTQLWKDIKLLKGKVHRLIVSSMRQSVLSSSARESSANTFQYVKLLKSGTKILMCLVYVTGLRWK